MTTTETKRPTTKRKPERIDQHVDEVAPNARNPYALAEFAVGRPIDWSAVTDPRAVLEDVFDMPYGELFDPRHDSPLYLGSRLDADGRLRADTVTPPEVSIEIRDSERPENRPEFSPRFLSDIQPLVGNFDKARLRSIVPTRNGGWQIEIQGRNAGAGAFVNKVFDRGMLDALINLGIFDTGWTPTGAEWTDTGRFYNEAAEYFDPIQGGLGDCGLIAALSSVAWTLPYTFAHRSRATGADNQHFKNQFRFTNPSGGAVSLVEATERIPVWASTSTPLYAHSSEPGETWPAQLEKAYAKWLTGTTSDRPDMTSLNASVWPDIATAVLTGRQPARTATAGQTTTAITNLVKSHCVNGRTVDPMTAWTYATAPDGVHYADANIVANHAYSVLGWVRGAVLFAGNSLTSRIAAQRDHVILRNPWGHHEGTGNPLLGAISLRDIGFTRTLDLTVDDGVFALDFSTFRRYYRAVGVAV